MSFAFRLKDARIKAGLSQQQLAAILKISQASYQRYEAGINEPDIKKLLLMATTLNVSMDWMLRGEQASVVREQGVVYGDCIPDLSIVPVYDIQASAGPGAFGIDAPPISCLALRNEFIKSDLKTSAAALFMIQAVGDSMEPVIRSGDMLLCDRSRKGYLSDGIYVVRVSDVLLVKFIHPRTDNVIQLDSANRALYTPICVEEGKHNFEVIARVVWICKKII